MLKANLSVELLAFLDDFERIFKKLTGNAFGINEFYQEISASDFFKDFLRNLKIKLNQEEQALYQTGSFKSYQKNVCSHLFWADGFRNLSNWIDIGVVAMITVGSTLMEVPGNISATVGLTAIAVITNSLIDFYNAYNVAKEMRKAERFKDLSIENSSLWQQTNIKYTWPLYATMILTMSLLGVYGIVSIKDYDEFQDISESEATQSKVTQFSANTALQHVSLFSSIAISTTIRKFNVSYLQYRKEHVDLRAQKHFFNRVLNELKNWVSEKETDTDRVTSTILQEIMEQILNHVCSDEEYLPIELRGAIREVALFQIRYLDLKNSLEKYPIFQDENRALLDREQQVLAAKLTVARDRLVGYLQEISNKFAEGLKIQILKSESVKDHLVAQSEDEIHRVLGQFAFSFQRIENYIDYLEPKSHSANSHLVHL